MAITSAENDVVEGVARETTPEEDFWLDWLEESPKQNLEVANNLLTRMVTLAAALAGGVAFLDRAVGQPLRPFVMGLFFISLICSVAGSWPSSSTVMLFPGIGISGRELENFKASKAAALNYKLRWLGAAALCLGGGLLLALLDLLGIFGRNPA